MNPLSLWSIMSHLSYRRDITVLHPLPKTMTLKK